MFNMHVNWQTFTRENRNLYFGISSFDELASYECKMFECECKIEIL